MLPYNRTFRKMLRRYIPQVSERQLRRHEELLAHRQQLIQERACVDDPLNRGRYTAAIQEATNQANRIFAGYENLYVATSNLWEARRRFAYKHGDLLQIPGTISGAWDFIRAGFIYVGSTIRNGTPLLINRWRDIIPGWPARPVPGTLVVSSEPPTSVVVNTDYVYQILLQDTSGSDDSKALHSGFHFKPINLPDFLSISSSGKITGRPNGNDLEFSPYQVAIDISQKDFHPLVHTYELEVTPDQGPVITSQPDPESLTIVGCSDFKYQVEAYDPEGGELRYDFLGKRGFLNIDENGLVSGTANNPREDEKLTVIVQVSDESGQSASQQFTITIKPLVK